MPSILDVFNQDLFGVISLTNVINHLPYVPTKIGDMGLFTSAGVDTPIVVVESSNGVLSLVPATPRGAPPQPKTVPRGQGQPFKIPQLPQRGAIWADELIGRLVLGSSDLTQTAVLKMTALQQIMRRDNDYTIEFQRLGAIKGLVLNADGTTLVDMYATFGAALPTPVSSIPTQVFPLGTDATKSLKLANSYVGMIEDALGGVTYDHIHAFCSADFFGALMGNQTFVESVKYSGYAQQNPILSGDIRYQGISWGGITWQVYRGAASIGGAAVPNIEAGTAYLFPVGVPDMFVTKYAPADYMETVGTIGLPYYTKQEPMDMDKGVNVETQSNPINLNTRPEAVLKLTLT